MAAAAEQRGARRPPRKTSRRTIWTAGSLSPDKNITSRHVSQIHSAQFKVGVVFTLHLQLASVFFVPSPELERDGLLY